jgi:hypothetical protein
VRSSPVDANPVLRQAVLAQLGGLLAVLVFAVGLKRLTQADPAGALMLLAMLQGGVAALIGRLQRAPPWWQVIHLVFAPLLVTVHSLDIAPGWFLAGFLVLLLVFWRTDKSRVPLYLSNRATAEAVLHLLPAVPTRVIDLGCGDGGLLRRLAKARPDSSFVGIEHAPLPWLLARLRTAGLANVAIRRGDFWDEPLSAYGLVYAFLSPTPMPRLWEKAAAEMTEGAMLVSNSFPAPEATADRIIRVADRRGTRLYCYRPNKTNDFAAFPAIPRPPEQE